MKFYSEEFKKIREQKGMSISQLIDIIGCSRVSIWLWENGKKVPSENKIRAIARALKIKPSIISDLLDGPALIDEDIGPVFNAMNYISDYGFEKEFQKINLSIKHLTELKDVLKNCNIVMNAVVKHTDSVLYVKNVNNKYVIGNDSFKHLLKLTEKAVLTGLSDSDLLGTKEADANKREDDEVLNTGKNIEKEDYILNTKKKRLGLIKKRAIFDSSGNIAGLMCTILDITEQKKVNELKELLELNVRHMTTAIAIVDLKTHKVLYINTAYEKIYGATAEDIYKGGFKYMCSLIHDDDREMIYNSMNPKNFVENVKFRLKKEHNGKPIWIKATRSKGTFRDRTCSISSSRFMNDELFSI